MLEGMLAPSETQVAAVLDHGSGIGAVDLIFVGGGECQVDLQTLFPDDIPNALAGVIGNFVALGIFADPAAAQVLQFQDVCQFFLVDACFVHDGAV